MPPLEHSSLFRVSCFGYGHGTPTSCGYGRKNVNIKAIYNGHISGQRQKGIKTNPLFLEGVALDVKEAKLEGFPLETSENIYLQDVIEVYQYRNSSEHNHLVSCDPDSKNHLNPTKMKSEYSNDGSITRTPLNYVINLYDKKNGHSAPPISDRKIKMDDSRMLHNENSTQSIKKSSLYYSPEKGVRVDRSEPGQISQPDSRGLEGRNPKNRNSVGGKNLPINDSYRVEVEVEINDTRGSVKDLPLTNKINDEFEKKENNISENDIKQSNPPSASERLCERVLGQKVNSSVEDKDKLSVSPHHVSSNSEENSKNSDEEKPVKPILLNPSPLLTHRRKKSGGSNTELKSVTFSEDTVFNENKSKRYKKEKINLRDIYRGKIDSDSAYAKVNPMFVDDEVVSIGDMKEIHSKPDNQWCQLTDDEKVARYPSKSVKDNPTNAELNLPSYLKQFVVDEEQKKRTQERNGRDAPYPYSENFSASEVPLETFERRSNYNPPFGRLIQRTLKKEKRKRTILWLSLGVLIFLIVGVSVGTGVFFGLQ
ncbi:hypothetical protein ScPMuIL_018209 [Solemya velum]